MMPDDKETQKIAKKLATSKRVIGEILSTEESFRKNMELLYKGLNESKVELPIKKECLDLLIKFRVKQAQVFSQENIGNCDSLVRNEVTNLDDFSKQAAQDLAKIFKTREFEEYMDIFSQFTFTLSRVQQLSKKEREALFSIPLGQQSFNSILIQPTQRGPRYKLLMDELSKRSDNKEIKEISESVDKLCHKNNEKQRELEDGIKNALEDFKSTKKNPKTVLHKILERSFKEPTECSPTYLKTLLPKAYPKFFEFNEKTGISIKVDKAKGRDAETCTNALNENYQRNNSKILDPKNFGASALQKLYQSDKNPLWLVLKSTKPIDDNFTAQNKIDTLLELTKLHVDGKISGKNQQKQASQLVNEALKIAEQVSPAQVGELQAKLITDQKLIKWFKNEFDVATACNFSMDRVTGNLKNKNDEFLEVLKIVETLRSKYEGENSFSIDEKTMNRKFFYKFNFTDQDRMIKEYVQLKTVNQAIYDHLEKNGIIESPNKTEVENSKVREARQEVFKMPMEERLEKFEKNPVKFFEHLDTNIQKALPAPQSSVTHTFKDALAGLKDQAKTPDESGQVQNLL